MTIPHLAAAAPFPNLEIGKNYDRQYLGVDENGRPVYQWWSRPERMLSGYENGQPVYVPYILTQDESKTTVETQYGSVILHHDYCSMEFHNAGLVGEGDAPLFTDSIVPKRATVGTTNWSKVSQIINESCIPVVVSTGSTVSLEARKERANVGEMAYRYTFTGSMWKTELEATNNSTLTDQKFGFTQTINLNRDTIRFGGGMVDLQNHNGTTYKRTWLVNNQGNVIDFLNGIHFDFDLGFERLNSVTVYAFSDGTAKLVFDYTNTDTALLPGQTVIIDPTYSSNAPTVDGRIVETDNNNICDNSGSYSKNTAATLLEVGRYASAETSDCVRTFLEYDISAIFTGSVITDSDFEYDVASIVGTPTSCDITGMDAQPSVISNPYMWLEIGAGTSLNTTAGCTSAGNSKSVDLGVSGNAYIQNKTAYGWAAFGIKATTENPIDASYHITQIASSEDGTATPKPTLTVTYTAPPPEPPTGLACNGGNFAISCTWTASVNGTYITDYYISRSLNNVTFANTTSTGNVTSYVITGLGVGQSYYVRVNATISGSNSTASNHVFATTNNVPDPPTLDLVLVNSTALNATSTAGASTGGDSVDWFGLRCDLNGAGWSTIVSNNTITNRKYTINGLWSLGDALVCQQRDGNTMGWSNWSANATYPAPPDAVTDLSVVGVFQTTADIMWSEPDLHGIPLLGYQVNFTSPWGTPLTIIAVTNSSDTEYTITGLTPSTQYSFRVSAVTLTGKNASGNIVNIGTASNFTVGNIDIDVENPLRFPIRFERTDFNDTVSGVTVTYDNEFDLGCDVYQQYAQSSTTYSNLNGTAASADEDEVTLYFINPENDVITIDCYDTATNETATYVMRQSDFVLLDLVNGFRNGDYGTSGQFGAIDLITMFAIIIGMIGFNRTNPSVGAIFMFFIIGGLAAFQIVQWYTAVSGIIATILMLVFASTRKDE